MKKQIFALILLVNLFFPNASVAARSVIISSDKNSVFGPEEINLAASISGFTIGEKIYVKGAFFREGTSNYFGFTKLNDSWIRNSESSTSQRDVIVGSWDLKTTIKPDFEDTGYSGKGVYLLKLGYYYQASSGLSSVNWSANNLTINLDAPSSTPAVETESKSSSSSKSSSPTPTLTPLPKNPPTPTKNPIFAKIASEIRSASEYARFRNSVPKSKPKSKILGEKTGPDYSVFWLLAGLIFLVASGVWIIFKYLKLQNKL